MENKEIRWEPYKEWKYRQEYTQLREGYALLDHPVHTPENVRKELWKEFNEKWAVKEKELELHFKEMDKDGK